MSPDDECLNHIERAFRKRCLAICAIAEGVYQQRVKTAAASRVALKDRKAHQVGDQVDVYLKPKHKDISGWHGPAEIIENNLEVKGKLTVRWQGDLKEVPPHLVRPFVHEAGYFVDLAGDHEVYVNIIRDMRIVLQELAESIPTGKHQNWGIVIDEDGNEFLKEETMAETIPIIRQARRFAHEAFAMAFCAGLRGWNSVRKLPGIARTGFSVGMIWRPEMRDDFQIATVKGDINMKVTQTFKCENWQSYCGLLFYSYQTMPDENELRNREEGQEFITPNQSEMGETAREEEESLRSLPSTEPQTPMSRMALTPLSRTPISTSVHIPRSTPSSDHPTASAGNDRGAGVGLSDDDDDDDFEEPQDGAMGMSESGTQTMTPNELINEDNITAASTSLGSTIGSAVGGAIGGAIGGPIGETVGGVIGDWGGSRPGESLGRVISSSIPPLESFGDGENAYPPLDEPPNVPGVDSVDNEAETTGHGPLYLPGLPLPVTQEEYDDPGEMQLDTTVTCSTLYQEILPNGLPPEMQAELDKDNELKTAFLGCVEGNWWDPEEYYTDVKTGFTYHADQILVGELTPEQEREYAPRVHEAKLKELKSWHDHRAFRVIMRELMPWKFSRAMRSRWVLTWKRVGGVDGEIVIKARLCVKGFMDAQAAIISTIAATVSLLMHRVFAATAVNSRKVLSSLDIGAAFLKGWSFEEFGDTKTEERRRAFFDLPTEEDYALLYSLDEVYYGLLATTYLNDLIIEALKGGFGFKDAPRMWRVRLHASMLKAGLLQSRYDECVYYGYPDEVRRRFDKRRKQQGYTNKRIIVEDIGTVLFDIAVNTHVDDLECICDDPMLKKFRKVLEGEFEEVKLERERWKHVGANYMQTKTRERIEIDQTDYVKQLKFYPVSKDRKKNGPPALKTHEQTNYRGSVGGTAWFSRWRLDLVSRVHGLQTKFQDATIEDLQKANAVTAYCQETADIKLVYKALPRNRRVRLVLFPDAAKGDYMKGSDKPVLAYINCLMVDQVKKLSGALQLWDWAGKKTTRVSKSSLHAEALAMAQSIEKAEKIAGIFNEMYAEVTNTQVLLERTEKGTLALEVDAVTDSKSLYDLLTGEAEPKPSDGGSLLWLLWIRERRKTGTVRRFIWATTYDMLSDGLTKATIDMQPLIDAMVRAEFVSKYSMLCEGDLWEPEKGLPPPKHAAKQNKVKDRAAMEFLVAYSKGVEAFDTLGESGLFALKRWTREDH